MFTPLIYTLRGIHKLNIKGVQMHEHTEIILKYKLAHCLFYNFLSYSDYTSVSQCDSTRMYECTHQLNVYVLMYTQ